MNKELIDFIFLSQKEDDKIQESYKNLFELIAPDSYPPFIEDKTTSILKTLEYFVDKDKIDWISYFLYEAESFYEKWCEITDDNKKYVINNEQEAKEFLVNNL